MSQTRARAWSALTDRLIASLPAETVAYFVGGTHTQRFADNLLPTLSPTQVATLREQLAAGNGAELTPNASGKRSAHAPYSSAVLAMNAFGGWLGREAILPIAGLTGFTEPLQFEAKLKIDHGGGTANLDVLLRDATRLVGVESKLTEPLGHHEPTTWRPTYREAQVATLLPGPWQQVFADSLAGSLQPDHLDIEQLIKHALALQSIHSGLETTLIYLYWEPTNAADFPECRKHREELAQLTERLGDVAGPAFNALTYANLFDEWQAASDEPWLTDHLAGLGARYELAVTAED